MVAPLNITSLQVKGYVIHSFIGVGALVVGHWILLAPIEAKKTRRQLVSSPQLPPPVKVMLEVNTAPALSYAGARAGFLRDTVGFLSSVVCGVLVGRILDRQVGNETMRTYFPLWVGTLVGTVLSAPLAVRRLRLLVDTAEFEFTEPSKTDSVAQNPFAGLSLACTHAFVVASLALPIAGFIEERFVSDSFYGSPLARRLCYALALGSSLAILNPVEVSVKLQRISSGRTRTPSLSNLFFQPAGWNGCSYAFAEAGVTVLGSHITLSLLQGAVNFVT